MAEDDKKTLEEKQAERTAAERESATPAADQADRAADRAAEAADQAEAEAETAADVADEKRAEAEERSESAAKEEVAEAAEDSAAEKAAASADADVHAEKAAAHAAKARAAAAAGDRLTADHQAAKAQKEADDAERAEADAEHDEIERRPALYLAEFETPAQVMHAAEKVRDAGYEHWDVHTPFPVHGMDKAMGLGQSHLGWICLLAGMTGLIGGYVMMYWMNGIDYPIIVGGKPPESIPSMVPILFECTVLLTGFGAVFGMLGLNKLPRHHHPVFYSERFERCSDDKFFISVEAADKKFDLDETRSLLESLNPSYLELVEEEVL